MGGGGVMKSAAKVFGYTVVGGGIRGVAAAENCPVSVAARKSASPVGVSSAGDVKQVVLQSQHDLHDWEFAGGEEDLSRSSGEPMKRLVFGGLPSLQEAKEATTELTLAVEKTYLSSPRSACNGGSVISDHDSTSLPNSNALEAVDISENCVATTEPTDAIRAFKLLSGSPAIQNVVTSLVCDQNVWSAVSQNPDLQELLLSQKTLLNFDAKESVAENDGQENTESKSGNWFQDFVQKMKLAVVDVISDLSGFFQSLFTKVANKMYVNADGTSRLNSTEKVMEASIFGLAVMAIMVILLKRA